MAVADDDDKDSKTENPTDKKITDAAEKGNVPFSREITAFSTAVAIYIYLVFFASEGMAKIAATLHDLFAQPEQWRLGTGSDIISLFIKLGRDSAALVLPALLLMMTFGIASSILQQLPAFVFERIRPQISRISPFGGFKRIFGTGGMVEFAKAFVKIVVVSTIMVMALKGQFYASLDSMFSDPMTIFTKLYSDIRTILLILLFTTATIAVADFFWTRHHWFTGLMMTKQEIKEEFKQSQGDPVIKARQRSIARDRARRNMIAAVPKATLVIANPTHFAVALRYVRDEDEAPVVIAKGQDLIALKIREIAEENGIPVFEDPPLARSMFAQVSVDSVIPAVFYKAVAELIHRVYAAKNPKRRNP
jgi:flagellar biosynthesis protein FlhB